MYSTYFEGHHHAIMHAHTASSITIACKVLSAHYQEHAGQADANMHACGRASFLPCYLHRYLPPVSPSLIWYLPNLQLLANKCDLLKSGDPNLTVVSSDRGRSLAKERGGIFFECSAMDACLCFFC